MCGICGYVNIDRRPVTDDTVIKAMMDAIVHRGPDDGGVFLKGSTALGHRRLSIIDLESGHQPIVDDAIGAAIVYNGEVYNFPELKAELVNRGRRFSTHSDTEVVLKAYLEWGPSCLARFNGMFALAIWDGRDSTLFLARDRFGKKPLYFGSFGQTFVFGSELKALYRHPAVTKEIDRAALAKYFAYDYIPAPRTILKGISKLEPGHYCILKSGAASTRRYWDFTFNIPEHDKIDLKEAKRTLVDLLAASVRRRLVSDVPLGVFLSGGIDSSAVVAMMARFMNPRDIKTFSIGYRERSYDESPAARTVARVFGTDHHERIIDADMMLATLPEVFRILDEPFADSSIIPTYLVSKFTRETVTVALGGDGGDELFMGYPSFVAHRLAALYDLVPGFGKRLVDSLAGFAPGKSSYMGFHFKLSRFLRGIGLPMALRHQTWIGSFPPSEQRELLADRSDERMFDPYVVYDESLKYFDTYTKLSELDRVEYLYLKTYLPDDILTKVDRASMATSLEVRAPFLDSDVASFAGTVPNRLKLKGLTTKYLLKEAFRDILPREIISKQKHGFAVPVGQWFREGLKPMLQEAFRKETVERDGVFDYAYIKKLLDDHFTGATDNGRKLWSLFAYQMWHTTWLKKGMG